jgi:ubiquinone/menaquinone biosynthesis C-methylase UbiE
MASGETELERSTRHRRRTLFNGVAELYQATRQSYPAEIVQCLLATAGIGQGNPVLEVGCGTGQLTSDIACRGFDLTAIDIGPAMIGVARSHVLDPAVSFQVSSFEDFAAADSSFDLIVSATAFHWIDPEVRFSKSARLLRPDGWLALLSTGVLYDDVLEAALHDMWAARSEDQAWAARKPPTDADAIRDSGYFHEPVQRDHARHATVAASAVIGVENTRAVTLSWPAGVRDAFTDELRSHLGGQTEVPVTLHAQLTMARASARRASPSEPP